MSSGSKNADRLAKDLYPYLAHKMTHSELRSAGWFDFVNHHLPQEADPVVIAFEALTYLFVQDGNWTGNLDGLGAVLAFLREKTGLLPSAKQVASLKAILEQQPVQEAGLEEWFYTVYPETEGR